MTKCQAIKPNGERCKLVPIGASQWCWHHSPENAGKLKHAGSKGGKRGGRGRPQADLAYLKDRLISLGEDVLEGKVARGNASVAGQLYNYAIGAIRTSLKAKEVEELEQRLTEVEVLLDRTKAHRQHYGTS